MTIERRLARAGFTLTRDFPVPSGRVWDAFAEENQKLGWWGAGDNIEPGEWAFDFRVGGRDIAEGTFHNGPLSRYEATYTDIVEHIRIVTTHDMWLDGAYLSTSVASLEFEPIDEGTRFTHVEHGVFFDQFWADGPNREKGSRGLLEALGNYLGHHTSRCPFPLGLATDRPVDQALDRERATSLPPIVPVYLASIRGPARCSRWGSDRVPSILRDPSVPLSLRR